MRYEDEIAQILARCDVGRPARVYLPGLFESDDWRAAIFPGALQARPGEGSLPDAPARDGFVYAGPYHWRPDEGRGDEDIDLVVAQAVLLSDPLRREEVLTRRLAWVREADIVFAWITTRDAYQAVIEISWAYVLGKPIFLAICSADFPDVPESAWDWEFEDGIWNLAMVRQMAAAFVAAPTAQDAWAVFCEWFRREAARREGAW